MENIATVRPERPDSANRKAMSRIIPFLAALLLCGCATVQQPAFRPSATTRALVNWKHGGQSLTADVIFQKGSGDSIRLLVSKEALLFTLTRNSGIWVAAGPLAHGGWRGQASAAPAVLRDWICLAEAMETSASTSSGGGVKQTRQYTVQSVKHGGMTAEIDVVVLATGSRFRVLF
jgi:hypothetical protein